jgi:penicillin-binding protein 1B
MDPSSGAIRAMVGGSDYSKSQFNRVTQAHRQPGSAFKPIVLAAALGESWPDLGPQSRVRDRPLRLPIRSESGSEWSPRNHDDRFLGSISLRKATETSRNPPFVRLALDIGIERVQSVAKAMGITSPIPALPSVAIGSAELTPLELATAYSTLANGGLRPEAHCLVGIRDLEGEWLERSMPRTTAAIDPRVAAVVTDMLEGVVERGTARSVRGGGLAIPLAGKTGTSNGSRDAWMAGYSSDLTVVVWVGFDEARTLGMSSTQAAVPIWADFMERIEPYLAGDSFDLPRGARELIARGGPARNDVERQRELEIEDSAMRDLEDAEMGTRRR